MMNEPEIFRWLFWIPLLFWGGIFFWFRYMAYPIELKKRVKKGKSWMYIPLWWKKSPIKQKLIRSGAFFIPALAVLSSVMVVYLFTHSPYLTFVSVAFFGVVAWFLIRRSSAYVPSLELECYFFLYRQLVLAYQREGKSLTETELKNRTTWKLNHLLLKADQHNRFFKYLKSMALSEKTPEDPDEEWGEDALGKV